MPGSENSRSFYYVYLLGSGGSHLYVGVTSDLKRRIREHNEKKVFSTRPYAPWELIYYEACRNKQDAIRREKYLKTSQGSRLLKRRLKEYFYISKA